MHFLEATFREACQTLGASILPGELRTCDDSGDYKVVTLNVDKLGYVIAGTLYAAGLHAVTRSQSNHDKDKTYSVTITYQVAGFSRR